MVAASAPRLCSQSHGAVAEKEKQVQKGAFSRLLSCPGTQALLAASLGTLGLITETSLGCTAWATVPGDEVVAGMPPGV